MSGEIRDPDALAGALRRFFDRHKLPKKGVRLGISNNRIGVRVFEIEGVSDERQLENAIRFRAEEVLPIPLDQAVLDYVVLDEGESADGTPLRRILLVVAYREVVERYLNACRAADLEIVGIDLEAFALLRSLAAPLDRDPSAGALVAVAVGHDRTTIAHGPPRPEKSLHTPVALAIQLLSRKPFGAVSSREGSNPSPSA